MSGASFGYGFILTGGTDSDFDAHLGRMTDKSNATLNAEILDLIVGLKEDDIWDKIVDFCILHDNLADSLLGIKGSSDSAEYDLFSGGGTLTHSVGPGNTAGITTGATDNESLGGTGVCINTQITRGNANDCGVFEVDHAYSSGGSTENVFLAGFANGFRAVKTTAFKGSTNVGGQVNGSAAATVAGLTNGFSLTSQNPADVDDAFFTRNASTSTVTGATNAASGGNEVYIGADNHGVNDARFGTNAGGPYSARFSAWGVTENLTLAEAQLLKSRLKTFLSNTYSITAIP